MATVLARIFKSLQSWAYWNEYPAWKIFQFLPDTQPFCRYDLCIGCDRFPPLHPCYKGHSELGPPAVIGILIEASQSNFGHFRDPGVYAFPSLIQIGLNTAAQMFMIVTFASEVLEARVLRVQLYRRLRLNSQSVLALDCLRLRRRAS